MLQLRRRVLFCRNYNPRFQIPTRNGNSWSLTMATRAPAFSKLSLVWLTSSLPYLFLCRHSWELSAPGWTPIPQLVVLNRLKRSYSGSYGVFGNRVLILEHCKPKPVLYLFCRATPGVHSHVLWLQQPLDITASVLWKPGMAVTWNWHQWLDKKEWACQHVGASSKMACHCRYSNNSAHACQSHEPTPSQFPASPSSAHIDNVIVLISNRMSATGMHTTHFINELPNSEKYLSNVLRVSSPLTQFLQNVLNMTGRMECNGIFPHIRSPAVLYLLKKLLILPMDTRDPPYVWRRGLSCMTVLLGQCKSDQHTQDCHGHPDSNLDREANKDMLGLPFHSNPLHCKQILETDMQLLHTMGLTFNDDAQSACMCLNTQVLILQTWMLADSHQLAPALAAQHRTVFRSLVQLARQCMSHVLQRMRRLKVERMFEHAPQQQQLQKAARLQHKRMPVIRPEGLQAIRNVMFAVCCFHSSTPPGEFARLGPRKCWCQHVIDKCCTDLWCQFQR